MKKFFSILVLLVSFISIQSLRAQTTSVLETSPGGSQLIEKVAPSSDPLIIPYEKWKLSNGLILMIHEDHSDPLAHLNVTYHVGSGRESLGKSGFAHFFEHMMFEGSDNVKDKEHFRLVSETGGNLNGFTQEDKTVYYETVPSNSIELALWLEADRMGFLLDSVTKERFENQRATVKNEKGQNQLNQPYGLTQELLGQALYPIGHPYSWPVIGYTDDLDRVTVDDLKSFFLRWYGPNNAVLVVAGDVNPKEILTMTEKYYGSIPKCPEVTKKRLPVPILSNDKYANYIDNVYLPLTYMVYPTVPLYHRDEPTLDILGSMMGEGKNSVFYKKFIKPEKGQGGTGHRSLELSGEFAVQLVSFPDNDDIDPSTIPEEDDKRERWWRERTQKDFNEKETMIHEMFDEFEKTGITDSALNRVKAQIESQIIGSTSTVFLKALFLADWQTYLGKQYSLKDEFERYDKVTKDDISRVFNKYIKGKHAAIVNVFPKDPESEKKDSIVSFNPVKNLPTTPDPEYVGLKYVKAKDNFDRSKKPVAGAAKLPVVPEYYTQTLKNGVKVIGTKTSETPTVNIQISLKGGDYVLSDLKKTGLAGLTAEMMNEGTKKYTTEQISYEVDRLGSSINFYGGGEGSGVMITSLAKNLDATLKLLEEKLFNPRFDEKDFKRVRKELKESLNQQKVVPDAVAANLFPSLVFGNTPMGSYATSKSVKKLSLDDVKNYYSQYYSPSAASIVVVGDITEADVMKKLEFLNNWKGKEVKMPDPEALKASFPPAQNTQIYFCDRRGSSAQSIITVGNTSMPFDATGEYFKANAMNFLLGGNFNSRLNLNLRETKGWTYGIYSGFYGSKYPGAFEASAGVRRSATDSAIVEIMKEIKNYSANGLTDDDVAFTKSALLNRDAIRYETPGQKAGFLARIQEYNLTKDYPSKQAEIVRGLSKDDFNSLAKKHINPDKMVILVVGNGFFIKDKISKLGYKVKEVDSD